MTGIDRQVEFTAKDEPLRESVGRLGRLVGEVIREQGGEQLFDAVEDCRIAAIERREHSGAQRSAAEARLAERVDALDVAVASELTRSFSIYFRLINLAEKVHRIRRRRDYLRSHEGPQPASVGAAIAGLVARGWTRPQLEALLRTIRIEPVFTAHPTESTRRTLLEKEQEIARILVERFDPSLTPPEDRASWDRLRVLVSTLWQTEEHPSARPSVGDERELILFFLSDVVQRVLPPFYESLEEALETSTNASSGAKVEVSENLIRFGSWVGGDMDGNPNVDATSILETLERHRTLVVRRYHAEALRLAELLTQTTPRVAVSEALTRRLGDLAQEFPEEWKELHPRHRNMPYRILFRMVAHRLELTHEGEDRGYASAAALLEDLDLAATSLTQNRGEHAGLFGVHRFQARVRALGFYLASLDLRQDALVHRQAVAELLGDPRWLDRTRDERTQRLATLLVGDEWTPPAGLSKATTKTLDVFRALTEAWPRFGHEAVHTFIISMTQGADDVLSVLALARWAGLPGPGELPLHISPLLETVPDLEAGPAIVNRLLSLPQYRDHVRTRSDRQPIMIGYSDSNKEGGIAASRWSIHRAQERLVDALRAFEVAPIFFHGRGGSISRGGGKTHRAVLAAPPGAITGRLRLTEQGETINAKYGLRGIALRTLDQMMAAVVEATARDHDGIPVTDPEARQIMDRVAEASRTAYRQLIWETPELVHYFRHATPIDVIERLALGSRPAKRSGRGEGIGGLRAIPWVFAWTQSRHILPGWFGLGTGLDRAAESHGEAAVRQMIAELAVAQTLLDGVEMVLAKADLDIAARYAALAGESGRVIFDRIRHEHDRTRRWILEIAGTDELLDRDPTLQRSIRLRNPYVDPMSFLQVELLDRWRRGDRQDDRLLAALRATVTGIAEGLQNTG